MLQSPLSWSLSYPSYFIPTFVNKEKNNDSGNLFIDYRSIRMVLVMDCFLLNFLCSFEQVTVEKIQAKGRSLSSCNNLAPCRFGVASIKNHSFLLHQQRLQLSLPVDCKKAIQPNLISAEAGHFVRVHHLASLASNPLNLTQGSINMMPVITLNFISTIPLTRRFHWFVCLSYFRLIQLVTWPIWLESMK